MKKLSIQPRLSNGQVSFLEMAFGYSFPEKLKTFIMIYADTSTIENCFKKANTFYKVSMFCTERLIFDFSNDFKKEGFKKKIPFAVDDGGWVYCLSVKDDITYGKVYLFQMEMPYENEQEAFELVADSFEEFINGLQPESDVS